MGQRIIGLTGGIATGKSTVAKYLEEHYGLPILDADIYARQAVEPGSKTLAAIAERYGTHLLNEGGSLDRRQLGQIIFNDAEEKRWLEGQIHPLVRQRFQEEMKTLKAMPTVVQAIPLLFEAQLDNQVTEIWVVVCSLDNQLQRLRSRDALPLSEAETRIKNQWPLSEKAARADIVLNNNASLASLYEQVDRALHANQL